MARIGMVVLAGVAAGCYSPSLQDGFECGPDEPRCPSGFLCAADSRCYRNGPPDGGVTRDAAPDSGVTRTPPRLLGDGRRVAIGRTSTGARVAYEDSTGTATSPAAIRYVDVSLGGAVSPEQSLEPNNTIVRTQLTGDGADNAYFGWLEVPAASQQILVVWSSSGNLPIVGSTEPVLNTPMQFDIAVAQSVGFVAWAEGSPPNRIQVRRIASTSLATTARTAPAGFQIGAFDLTASDDGQSLLLAFHEANIPATGTAIETVSVMRLSNSLAPVWSMPTETARVTYGVTVNRAFRLRRPRVAVSSRAGAVAVAMESGMDMGAVTLSYANGGSGAQYGFPGFSQPALVALPVGASGGAGTPSTTLAAIRRGALGERGPLDHVVLGQAGSPVEVVLNATALLSIGDDRDNVYWLAHDGNDSGGRIVGLGGGFPPSGLTVNSTTNAARPQLAAARRAGGGLFIAWVEDGADEGQVWVHTLLPDATTP